MSTLDLILTGGIATAALVAALFFLRFWWQTRDRFFLYFALSFWLEAFSRITLGLLSETDEGMPHAYGVRLVAYALILLAIWQKNRPRP